MLLHFQTALSRCCTQTDTKTLILVCLVSRLFSSFGERKWRKRTVGFIPIGLPKPNAGGGLGPAAWLATVDPNSGGIEPESLILLPPDSTGESCGSNSSISPPPKKIQTLNHTLCTHTMLLPASYSRHQMAEQLAADQKLK